MTDEPVEALSGAQSDALLSGPPAASLGVGRSGEHRPHTGGKDRRVNLRLTDAELSAVTAAADRAGLTPASYASAAVLAAATQTAAPQGGPLQEAMVELLAARTLLVRVSTNLNQLTRVANAIANAVDPAAAAALGGEPVELPAELRPALTAVRRVADRLEMAIDAIHDRVGAGRPGRRVARAQAGRAARSSAARAAGRRAGQVLGAAGLRSPAGAASAASTDPSPTSSSPAAAGPAEPGQEH